MSHEDMYEDPKGDGRIQSVIKNEVIPFQGTHGQANINTLAIVAKDGESGSLVPEEKDLNSASNLCTATNSTDSIIVATTNPASNIVSTSADASDDFASFLIPASPSSSPLYSPIFSSQDIDYSPPKFSFLSSSFPRKDGKKECLLSANSNCVIAPHNPSDSRGPSINVSPCETVQLPSLAASSCDCGPFTPMLTDQLETPQSTSRTHGVDSIVGDIDGDGHWDALEEGSSGSREETNDEKVKEEEEEEEKEEKGEEEEEEEEEEEGDETESTPKFQFFSPSLPFLPRKAGSTLGISTTSTSLSLLARNNDARGSMRPRSNYDVAEDAQDHVVQIPETCTGTFADKDTNEDTDKDHQEQDHEGKQEEQEEEYDEDDDEAQRFVFSASGLAISAADKAPPLPPYLPPHSLRNDVSISKADGKHRTSLSLSSALSTSSGSPPFFNSPSTRLFTVAPPQAPPPLPRPLAAPLPASSSLPARAATAAAGARTRRNFVVPFLKKEDGAVVKREEGVEEEERRQGGEGRGGAGDFAIKTEADQVGRGGQGSAGEGRVEGAEGAEGTERVGRAREGETASCHWPGFTTAAKSKVKEEVVGTHFKSGSIFTRSRSLGPVIKEEVVKHEGMPIHSSISNNNSNPSCICKSSIRPTAFQSFKPPMMKDVKKEAVEEVEKMEIKKEEVKKEEAIKENMEKGTARGRRIKAEVEVVIDERDMKRQKLERVVKEESSGWGGGAGMGEETEGHRSTDGDPKGDESRIHHRLDPTDPYLSDPAPSNPNIPEFRIQDLPQDRPWWSLFLDFVPVSAMLHGLDPRTNQPVHVNYLGQFTATVASSSAAGNSRSSPATAEMKGSSGDRSLSASRGRSAPPPSALPPFPFPDHSLNINQNINQYPNQNPHLASHSPPSFHHHHYPFPHASTTTTTTNTAATSFLDEDQALASLVRQLKLRATRKKSAKSTRPKKACRRRRSSRRCDTASEEGGGRWYTSAEGRKVFVDSAGRQFVGREAYRRGRQGSTTTTTTTPSRKTGSDSTRSTANGSSSEGLATVARRRSVASRIGGKGKGKEKGKGGGGKGKNGSMSVAQLMARGRAYLARRTRG